MNTVKRHGSVVQNKTMTKHLFQILTRFTGVKALPEQVGRDKIIKLIFKISHIKSNLAYKLFLFQHYL
jgi:hypothetical protein